MQHIWHESTVFEATLSVRPHVNLGESGFHTCHCHSGMEQLTDMICAAPATDGCKRLRTHLNNPKVP